MTRALLVFGFGWWAFVTLCAIDLGWYWMIPVALVILAVHVWAVRELER